ncbi:MAG: helix-turn-helix domain-containing protein [Chitinophagia bacterium]
MYATLAFSITLLGLFSIFELLRGNQKISLIKYHFIARLMLLTAGSFFDYLKLNGNEIPYYQEIFRLIAALLFVNMLFLIVVKKLPKIVIGLEIFFTLYFIIQFANGFQVPNIKDGMLQNKPSLYQFIFFGTYLFLILSAIIYNVFQLSTIKNFSTNLYESKIRRWVLSYMICLLVLFFINILLYTSLVRDTFVLYNDSIVNSFIHRFLFIFFILLRPKFLDDDKYSTSFNQILSSTKGLAFKEFEFLFYANHYYLQPNANMEDFALKLNVTKNELSLFLRDEIEENFTELLNKNRVEYFKQLLNSKKYESFTIEALSEMSGFNNRRTMYNAFNKHVGITPTEFIQRLK